MTQRRALAPLDVNRSCGKELTPFQRGQISAFKAMGLSNKKISDQLQIPKTTVFDTLVQNSLRNNGESLPRSGRPSALNHRQKRMILRLIRLHPKITYQALALEANVTVHRKTLYRILKEEGITNWISRKRPLLTPQLAALRLAWCLKRKDWTWEDWLKIIFSDECSLERGAGARRLWVFRTPQQRWEKEMIQPFKKGKDISVMIWGAIHGKGRSDIVIMDRDPDSEKSGYTANSYLTVLREQIPRIYEPGRKFMQDNARIHTAKKVTAWFKEEAVEVMEWPAYSPDLNPIEHLWAQLKQWINDHYSELITMGKSEQDYQRLFQAIHDAWDSVEEEAIVNLIKSMDNRINAVIAANGWYTRY